MTPEPEGRTVTAVVLSVEEVLVPFQTVRAWQWAWRPQGPLLGERHVQTVLRRARRAWDHRRWLGLTGKAPPADARALVDHLGETLRAIAGHALGKEEGDAVVRRLLRPTGEIERFADVPPLLARLARAGIRAGAVSSLPEESARWLLHRLGLAGELLLGAGDPPGPVVPAPEALRIVLEKLAVPPSSAAFVGGLYWSDVRAAERLGLTGILLDRVGSWPHVQAGRVLTLDGLEATLRARASGPQPLPTPEPRADPNAARPSADLL